MSPGLLQCWICRPLTRKTGDLPWILECPNHASNSCLRFVGHWTLALADHCSCKNSPLPGVLVRLQPSHKRVSLFLVALSVALFSSISLFTIHLFNLLHLQPAASSCLSSNNLSPPSPCLSLASLLNSDVCKVCWERWV